MKSRSLIFLFCAVLAGCGSEEHQDLKNWMTEQSASMRGRVPPLPQIRSFAIVDYDSAGLPSPFNAVKLEPEKRASSGGANRPDTNRRREPLEAFPLESLKMVGMMNGTAVVSGKKVIQPVALIQADKVLHQARVGNYLGQNFGVITQINENGLTLKELIEDANGDWVERVSTMELQEQEAKK